MVLKAEVASLREGDLNWQEDGDRRGFQEDLLPVCQAVEQID